MKLACYQHDSYQSSCEDCKSMTAETSALAPDKITLCDPCAEHHAEHCDSPYTCRDIERVLAHWKAEAEHWIKFRDFVMASLGIDGDESGYAVEIPNGEDIECETLEEAVGKAVELDNTEKAEAERLRKVLEEFVKASDLVAFTEAPFSDDCEKYQAARDEVVAELRRSRGKEK